MGRVDATGLAASWMCGRLPVHQVCAVPHGGMSRSPDRRCAYPIALLPHNHHDKSCSVAPLRDLPCAIHSLLSCIVVSHVYKSPLRHTPHTYTTWYLLTVLQYGWIMDGGVWP